MLPTPPIGAQWSNRLVVERCAARGSDQLGVTGALSGIAETGSVMLLPRLESSTTLSFLPEDHIAVLRASRIVLHPEDAWALLRQERDAMPRTVNLIYGPSKTGDVEFVITEGAHGPRRFHVVVTCAHHRAIARTRAAVQPCLANAKTPLCRFERFELPLWPCQTELADASNYLRRAHSASSRSLRRD